MNFQLALDTLAKNTPFGAFCLLLLWILQHNNNKMLKQINENYKQTIKENRLTYSESLEFCKEIYQNKNKNRRS